MVKNSKMWTILLMVLCSSLSLALKKHKINDVITSRAIRDYSNFEILNVLRIIEGGSLATETNVDIPRSKLKILCTEKANLNLLFY